MCSFLGMLCRPTVVLWSYSDNLQHGSAIYFKAELIEIGVRVSLHTIEFFQIVLLGKLKEF